MLHIKGACIMMAAMASLTSIHPAHAVTASPEEMAAAERWVNAKFEGVEDSRPVSPGLVVMANYGLVQRNARDGQPLRIGETTYSHGLFCHAVSGILVRLPEPGKDFTAAVGVDTNGQYSGGSAVFTVNAGGDELFRSPVMHRGEAAVPVAVDLGGALELVLAVEDGGDNINSDQASWADAVITLASGTRIRLGDMDLLPAEREPISTAPPFSFLYDGKPSDIFLPSWRCERTTRALDAQRMEWVLTYTDPSSILEIRCAGIQYFDFPVVEWTIHFKNTGAAPSPILSDIRALDTRFDRGMPDEFILRHNEGTTVSRADYQPHATTLTPGMALAFTPAEGRPCAREFPYYNIEGGGEGVILAIGWPGKWSASFTRDAGMGLRVTAGQELTHFALKPGEEVRTPLIALLFWTGDTVRAQNLWRRWMLAHGIPQPNGAPPPPQMPAVSGNQFPGLLCNEADEIRYLDRFAEEGVQLTHWWMDAGWYLNKGDWTSTGTWEVDKARFPNGVRAVADHAHAQGLKLIVWFEPERVTAGSWLAETHPEWVLGGKAGGLLNLGDPQAWAWLVDHFDKIITEEGIDYYRQDFNMDPLPFWRANDAPDRQGITEIRHVEGYLAFWDELVRRHPGMLIDSCASGGHRNDLETLRRALPLLRSDYILDASGEQCHTYGLASWFPYYGTGLIDIAPYLFRSCMGPNTTLSCDARRKDLDWDIIRKLTAEWREAVPEFYGDFHPITPYSLEEDVWMAWQFNRPETSSGLVQAFRRKVCPYETARFPLKDLEPDAVYEVHNVDEDASFKMTGQELMDAGVPIALLEKPAAAVILYKKK